LAQQRDGLIVARDGEAQARTEAQARIAALEQQQSDWVAQQQALVKEKSDLGNTLAETQKTVEKLRADISDRESDLAECRHRQQLMNDELLKAEAQIELIKDLLLREPGL